MDLIHVGSFVQVFVLLKGGPVKKKDGLSLFNSFVMHLHLSVKL